jgi:hypothetical protein
MRILFAAIVVLSSITLFGPRAAADLLGPVGVYLAIVASCFVPFLSRDPPASSLPGDAHHPLGE